MKKRLVVLVTYKYPYEPPTEQFLEKEIEFWKHENVDVVFCPIAREIADNNSYAGSKWKNSRILRVKRQSIIKEIVLGGIQTLKNVRHFIKDILFILFVEENKNKVYAIKKDIQMYIQAGAIYKELRKTLKIVELKKYQEIILYSYWLNPAAVSLGMLKGFLLKSNLSTRFISRAHGDGDLYWRRLKAFRPGYTILAKYIDKIYVISEGGCEYLHNQKLKNVDVNRLGVDNHLSFIKASPNNLIVSCSVVNINKRVDLIARAIANASTVMAIEWVHFGDGPEFEKLKEWCVDNMPANVKWTLKGRTSNEDIMHFYETNNPSLFINVSLVEGIPVSIMEACSCSIPIIATNVGATCEIVKNNENGFLVCENTNETELADVIVSYLNMKSDEQNRFRMNAYNIWKNNYSTNNFKQFVSNVMSIGDE